MLVTSTKEFAQVINRDTNRKAIRLAFKVFNGVKRLSPVRTGAFKAAWVLTINSINGLPVSPGPDGFFDENNINFNQTGFKFNGAEYPTILISNPKKYGPALERGHSKQAPHGMLAVTLASIN